VVGLVSMMLSLVLPAKGKRPYPTGREQP
jgi:hypothetical protein